MTTRNSAPSCARYRRISEDKTGAGEGVASQDTQTARLAKGKGWRIDPALDFMDNDVSATSGRKRPDFDRLLEAIKAGRVQRLVVTEWERIERTREDGYLFLQAAVAAGVHVALVRGADLDLASPAGQLTADLMSSIARHEIAQKNQRAADMRAHRLANGQRAGGARPFGYTRSMIVLPDEAAAIRECYRRVLAKESLGSIARWLNSTGMLTPMGRQWEPGNLGQALRKGTYVARNESKGAYYGAGAWTPLVDAATWERAQTVLTAADRRRNLAGTEVQLLTGIALCGVCADGTTLHGGGSGGPNAHPIYRCSKVPHLSMRRSWVDDYLIGFCSDMLTSGQLWLAGARAAETPVPGGLVAPALEAEIQALEARKRALAGDLKLPEDALVVRLAALDDALRELRVRRTAELSKPAPLKSTWVEDLLGADRVTRYGAGEAFRRAGVETQRQLLRTTFTITVHPAGRGARRFNPDLIDIGPPPGYQAPQT